MTVERKITFIYLCIRQFKLIPRPYSTPVCGVHLARCAAKLPDLMPGLVPCRALNSDLRPDYGIRDPIVDPDQARGCGAMLVFEGRRRAYYAGAWERNGWKAGDWNVSRYGDCAVLRFLYCGSLEELRGT
jgi:hypothetical protein